jgi:tripartite ATP-independent transporter DctP family solute receptor
MELRNLTVRRSKLVTGIIGLMLVAFLALIATGHAQTVLRFGHIANPGQPVHSGALEFARLVDEKTGGAVKIEVFPSGQLGGSRDLIEGVQLGTVDLTIVGPGALGGFYAPYNWTEYPFIYASDEHVLKVMQGEIGSELAAELLKATGTIRPIAQNWLRTPRHVFTTKKPVQTVEDLAGMKIRVPSGPLLEGFRAMGAAPTPVDFSELFTAMQQGVVDGAELPIDYIYDNGFYEIAKYLSLTGHVYAAQVLLMNDTKFGKLSAENQAAIVDAAIEAGIYQNAITAEVTDSYQQKLEEAGMTIIHPDREGFAEAAATGVEALQAKWGAGWYQRIRDAR